MRRSRRCLRVEKVESRELLAHGVFGESVLRESDLVAVGDVTGDSVAEVAVVHFDTQTNQNVLSLFDGSDSTLIKETRAGGTTRSLDIEVYGLEGASPKLAWAMEYRNSGRSIVQLRDLKSGTRAEIFLGMSSGHQLIDMEVFEAGGGDTRIAILSHNSTLGTNRIKVIDAETGLRIDQFVVSNGWIPEDLAVTENGYGDPILVIAESVITDEAPRQRLQTRSPSGDRLSTVSFRYASDSVTVFDHLTHVARDAVLASRGSLVAAAKWDAATEQWTAEVLSSNLDVMQSATLPSEFIPIAIERGAADGWYLLLQHKDNGSTQSIRFDEFGLGQQVHHGNGFDSVGFSVLISESEDSFDRIAILQSSDEFHQSRIRVATANRGRSVISTPLLADPSIVPDWYDANRFQVHTRMGPIHPNPERDGFYGTEEFERSSEGVAALGASVLTRHFNSRNEDPWWPSQFPASPEGPSESLFDEARINEGVSLEAGRNLGQEYVDEAVANGVHLIAYDWISSEDSLAAEHPEWICRNADGDAIAHSRRSKYLDLASGYSEIVLGRLLEQASMGAVGYYFDSYHLPAEGCWGGAFEQSFTQETGLDAPLDSNDPNYSVWLAFKTKFLGEYFQHLADEVHRQYPHMLFIISNPTLEGLFDTQTDSRQTLAGIYKTEFSFSLRFDEDFFEDRPTVYQPEDEIRMSLGWQVSRAASNGLPPHVWMSGFSSENQAETFVGSLLTHGAIANFDVPEANFLVANDLPDQTTRAVAEATAAFGVQLSEHLEGTNIQSSVGILFSESLRDSRSSLDAQYSDAIAPLIGSYQAMRDHQILPKVLFDWSLTKQSLDSDAMKVLVVPDRSALSAIQEATLVQYESDGGVVIEPNKLNDWSTQSGYQAAVEEIATDVLATVTPRFELSSSSRRLHLVEHQSVANPSQSTVMISNGFDHVVSIRSQAAGVPLPEGPEPVSGLIMTIVYPEGVDQSNAPMIEVRDGLTDALLDVQTAGSGWKVVVPTLETVAALLLDMQPATFSNSSLWSAHQQVCPAMTDDRMDVNQDGQLTPIDVLVIINRLAADQASLQSERSVVGAESSIYRAQLGDVNQDGIVSALDALLVLNALDRALL